MSETVSTEQPASTHRIVELRAAGHLLGKLILLPDGRQVVELRCRGRDCPRLCSFDLESGEPVHVDRLS